MRTIFKSENVGKKQPTGFTLVELLVVISIIGILAALAIPLFAGNKVNAIQARVQTDLRNVAMAEEAYFVDYEKFLSCANAACSANLSGVVSLSQGVTLQITATTSGFTGTATHPQTSKTCTWDSSQTGFTGCS